MKKRRQQQKVSKVLNIFDSDTQQLLFYLTIRRIFPYVRSSMCVLKKKKEKKRKQITKGRKKILPLREGIRIIPGFPTYLKEKDKIRCL